MTSQEIPLVIRELKELNLTADQRVFTQGQSAENYLIVIQGCVRVFARSSEGKEVVLYRVREGEMCILTTVCLLGHTNYPAEAITELNTVAKVIPADRFNELLNESPSFRQYVFEGLSQRLAQVMERFEHMVLEGVHKRLADFLLDHTGEDRILQITHEMLAVEIGTAREVVSRHLKSMERDGLIAIQRGKIIILKPDDLSELN